jgi:hypothetical protein
LPDRPVVIVGPSGKAAVRSGRVSSNYKGFPVCQTNRLSGESRQRFTVVIRSLSFRFAAQVRWRRSRAKGADWRNYNRSWMQS